MSEPKRQTHETDTGYEWDYYDADGMDEWLKAEVLPVLRNVQTAITTGATLSDKSGKLAALIAKLEDTQ